MITKYLRENDYEGVIPEVLLTYEAHSFTVDSKDKSTGAKRREKIYFSINDIADPNLAFSRLFGHEKAHMNTYDEGKYGEETSIHTREKIGNENKNKVFTEEEKANYLNDLRNKYKDQKSIEQQFAEAKLVPEKDKEHWMITISEGLSVGMVYYININGSIGTIINENNGKVYVVTTAGGTLGGGTPSIGYTSGINIYPFINNPEEVSRSTKNIGGKVLNLVGVDVNFGKTRTSIGIGKSFNLKGKLSKLSGTANVEGLLGEAFPKLKNALKYEFHGGASYTQLIGAVEITNRDFLSKLEKKDGIRTKSPENILKITNYLKENPDKLKILENTTEKLIEKKRAIDPYE